MDLSHYNPHQLCRNCSRTLLNRNVAPPGPENCKFCEERRREDSRFALEDLCNTCHSYRESGGYAEVHCRSCVATQFRRRGTCEPCTQGAAYRGVYPSPGCRYCITLQEGNAAHRQQPLVVQKHEVVKSKLTVGQLSFLTTWRLINPRPPLIKDPFTALSDTFCDGCIYKIHHECEPTLLCYHCISIRVQRELRQQKQRVIFAPKVPCPKMQTFIAAMDAGETSGSRRYESIAQPKPNEYHYGDRIRGDWVTGRPNLRKGSNFGWPDLVICSPNTSLSEYSTVPTPPNKDSSKSPTKMPTLADEEDWARSNREGLSGTAK